MSKNKKYFYDRGVYYANIGVSISQFIGVRKRKEVSWPKWAIKQFESGFYTTIEY